MLEGYSTETDFNNVKLCNKVTKGTTMSATPDENANNACTVTKPEELRYVLVR